MDTTPKVEDPIDRVHRLLQEVSDVDPAEAIEPLAAVADLLEAMLEEGDEA
ncbi:MAG TPA: hypothetical protein VLB67_04125 [Acidimicrobiia bacterium]|nr:hypothetical protein [Acidimicrobiia bacterium]